MRSNPFTDARPYLSNGELGEQVTVASSIAKKQKYLCLCLLMAYRDAAIVTADFELAKTMVYTRLGASYACVESFLCNEAHIPLGQLTPESVQAYRFLWLKELEQLWNQGERV